MGQPTPETVFINMPYAAAYEERLLALIGGLSLYGVIPTAATVAGEHRYRLPRIIEAIQDCALSIHDLSWRAHNDAGSKSLRFNMPFELGIAVALQESQKNDYVVIDTTADGLNEVMSDIRGLDVEIFDGTPMGVFRILTNIFHRDDFQPAPRDFRRVFGRLNTLADRLRTKFGYVSIFQAGAFAELRRLAGKLSNDIRSKAGARNAPAARPSL
jgi:hypothetical protein